MLWSLALLVECELSSPFGDSSTVAFIQRRMGQLVSQIIVRYSIGEGAPLLLICCWSFEDVDIEYASTRHACSRDAGDHLTDHAIIL